MFIYGRNSAIERLKSNEKIIKAYILEGKGNQRLRNIIEKLKEKNIPITYEKKHFLNKLVEDQSHQGVVLEIPDFQYSSLDDLFNISKERGEAPFFVILDEIEDPHNLGSIIRTAESAGVHGIIIPERRSASVNGTVFNTSSGAVNYIKIAQVANINRAIEVLKEKGLWIYGTSGEAEEIYTKTDLTGSLALVIGNEGKGMRRLVRENCDFLIKIPLFGSVSSLNASNACAVVLYEIVRQRHEKG